MRLPPSDLKLCFGIRASAIPEVARGVVGGRHETLSSTCRSCQFVALGEQKTLVSCRIPGIQERLVLRCQILIEVHAGNILSLFRSGGVERPAGAVGPASRDVSSAGGKPVEILGSWHKLCPGPRTDHLFMRPSSGSSSALSSNTPVRIKPIIPSVHICVLRTFWYGGRNVIHKNA